MRHLTTIALGLALFITTGAALPAKKFTAAPPPAKGEALLYIFRPGTPPLTSRAVTYIDDVRIADFPAWGYTYVYLKPGAYFIRTSWPGAPELVSEENFAAGETYVLRLENPVGLAAAGRTVYMIPPLRSPPESKDERDLAASNYITPQVQRLSRLGGR